MKNKITAVIFSLFCGSLAVLNCTYEPPLTLPALDASVENGGSGGETISSGSVGSGFGGFGGMNQGGAGGQMCIPSSEICNGLDDDCDGIVDGLTIDSMQPCGPLEVQYWYKSTGDYCNYGTTLCQAGILSCELVPVTPEICGDKFDNDCDGKVEEGCSCVGTEVEMCYTGNPDFLYGECHYGTSACDNGVHDGVCVNFAVQSAEVCGDGKDNDCDGLTDEFCP